jgi:enediyne biosynthesis protein E4
MHRSHFRTRFLGVSHSFALPLLAALPTIGKHAIPDAIGARITWQAGDLKRTRLKVGGGSYLSSHDPREVLGIGNRTKIDKLEIRWPQPSGRVETFRDLAVDRYITIVEGAGIQ